MRIRVVLLVCGLVAAIGMLIGFVAPMPLAEAQEPRTASCPHGPINTQMSPSPLAANGGSLLTRDGTGFFTDALSSMAVRSGSSAAEVQATSRSVGQALTDFYFGSDVEVFVDLPGPATRVVIVDGDIAVPGYPTVFAVGGVQTLYLHWTTAQADIDRLLDMPSFETLTAGSNEPPCQSADASPRSDVTPPPAPPLAPRPDDVLAYVNEQAEPSSTLDQLVRTPLADSTTPDEWPLPIVAAAVLVTAGGVVLYQRDKIWGDRYAPVREPAEALLAASKPKLPVADLPPAMPRVIFLDDQDNATPGPSQGAGQDRQIDLHAKRPESQLARLVEKVAASGYGPVLSRHEFARQVNTEWTRHQQGGADGAVASLVLSELDAVRLRLGNHAAEDLFAEVADHVVSLARPLDVVGMAGDNELAILMLGVSEAEARDALHEMAKKIAGITFETLGERVLLTPATGFALLSDTQTAPDLIRAVENARAMSMLNMHLDPERWDSTAVPLHSEKKKASTWSTVKAKLRTPAQILITVIIAWVLPFLLYTGLAAIGLDVSFLVYLFLVFSLVMTGAFILAEGVMALKQKEPPELPPEAFPKASALIAAYMPNEAATVIETIDAFLAMDYPNDLQIILAYNTPDPLPVEEHLDRIAAEHPNFVPVRIVGSNSKAQNVNAALSMATGEFIGMFDADHQPRPDAFTRAWRWISDGYDVVQGHCLTRNGDAGFLAKMIAVEFESIYAVAHPGRAKMHRFGVFGGSNGFWRTELLHETRMRGSMLTEDIDSSMRVIERGFKIRNDRDLVSRELATTTFQQIWNQRMRWAQGWFQVSMEHMKLAYRSKQLNIRQKLGIFHLLMWREIYPWLSQQLFPLLAFWALRAGGLGELDWTIPIFVVTSVFTFSVGPLQCVFAYRLADPEIKQHKRWFWAYLLFTTPFYTEYKNLIARVAHVKQFMGESDWRVTPRSAD